MKIVPTQYTLYRSCSTPVTPQHIAQNWNTGGNAFTSITIPMPFDKWNAAGAKIVDAFVIVAWKPNSINAHGDTGVGFMLCPPQSDASSGLTGAQPVALFSGSDDLGPSPNCIGCNTNIGGPFPCRLDVTAIMQGFLDQGLVDQSLVLVSFGNTVTGPIVWLGEIWISWA